MTIFEDAHLDGDIFYDDFLRMDMEMTIHIIPRMFSLDIFHTPHN